MEPSDLLNIEQQSFTLSENVKKLINNRTENLTRLREQRKNCYTEMKAFRNDLNKFLDKIEDEFFNELSMLEREQIDKIQSVVWELGNITKAVENVKMQLKEIKNCASSKDMNESKLNTLQQIKRSLSENELNVYTKCNTLTDGSGWKEIDLNMSPDPALQIVTSKIKSLGEVFITTCPVSIALDGKKPVVEDIEMTEENLPENEDKEKEKEKEAPTRMDLPTDIHMQSKAQSPISPMKATNIDLKTLITKKSIIQTWPKTERDKASRERNFFNTVVRNVVQTTGIRSIKGDNFNTLFSKVKQCIPNLSLEEQQVESFYRRALINFMSYKRKREQDYIPGGQKNPRSIYPTDVLQYALLKSGTDVCLSDGVNPVAKAKIIYYPAMELGMNKEQQREFASVQILLKRRNADVPKLPFLDDIRSWKDIGKDSKISWRITDIRPIDYYEKSIKQVNLHRRSIARREKMQALKGPNQPEPDNIDQKPINQTSVNCEPLNNTPVNHPTNKEGPDVQEPTYIEPINLTPVNQESSNEEDVNHEPLNNTPVNHLTDNERSDVHEPTTIEPINLTPVKQECSNEEDVNHEPLNNTPVNHPTDNEGPDVHEPATIEPINLTPVKQECTNEEDVNHEPLNNTPVNHPTDNEGPDVHEPTTIEPINLTPVKQECTNEEDVNHEPLNNTPVNHPTDNEGPDVHEPTTIEPINLTPVKQECTNEEDVNHEPLNNTPVNHPTDNEGPDVHEPATIEPINLTPVKQECTNEEDVNHEPLNNTPVNHPTDNEGPDVHGPATIEPINLTPVKQECTNEEDVNHEPLNNTPVNHPSDNEGPDVHGPATIEPINLTPVKQECTNQEDVNHAPLNNTPVNHPSDNEGPDVHGPATIEPINQDCNSGAEKNPRRIIYPTDVVHFALLKSGTNVCLCDGEFPVGKAKIMFYPDINLDMTEDQQREFTNVQILLKRRNADLPKLPFLDDIRSWKDIRRRSKISWRITDIRPLDYYDKYIKQGDLHRRFIARRVKKQSEKGPYQPEPDNIGQKPINQTSINCGPLNNMPVNHSSDNEGSDVQKPTYTEIINLAPVNQESSNKEDVNQEPVNHEPLNNMPVNHPTDNEGFDDQEPTNIEPIKQETDIQI